MLRRPADIAKRIGISTTALRRYEEAGLVPPVERAPNGYRVYTEEHEAYFVCICEMSPGFGWELTADVMKCLIRGEYDEAMWMVNGAQAELNRKKQMAGKTIQALESEELKMADAVGVRRGLTIGEAAKEASVPASAIRHWEKVGLIELSRHPESGYRLFGPSQLRKILIIGTLRTSVWSLDVIKQVIRELDHNNLEQARQIVRQSLQYLNETNRKQLRGVHYLYKLLERTDRRQTQEG